MTSNIKDEQLLNQINHVDLSDEKNMISLWTESLVSITANVEFYQTNQVKFDSFLLKVIKLYGHSDNGNNLNEMLFLFWQEKKVAHDNLILKMIEVIIDNNIALNFSGRSNIYQTFSTNQVLLTPCLILFTLSELILVSKLERQINLTPNQFKKFLLKQKLKINFKKCCHLFKKIYRYIVANTQSVDLLSTYLNPLTETQVPFLTYFLLFDCSLNSQFLNYVFSFDSKQVAHLSVSYEFLKILSTQSKNTMFHEKLFKSFTHAQSKWLKNKEPLNAVEKNDDFSLNPIYSGVATILSFAPENMIDFYLNYQKELINVNHQEYIKYNWASFILSNPSLSLEFKNNKLNHFYQLYEECVYTPNLFVMSLKGLIDSKFELNEKVFLDNILSLPNVDKNASFFNQGNAYFLAIYSINNTKKLLNYLGDKKINFQVNAQGTPALHKLIELPPNFDTEEVFEILKDNKIDFDNEDEKGNTAIHHLFNHYMLNDISFTYFTLLLMSGAHVNIKNHENKTAKDLFYEKMEKQKSIYSLIQYEDYYIKFESLLMSTFELDRLQNILIKPQEIKEKKMTKI